MPYCTQSNAQGVETHRSVDTVDSGVTAAVRRVRELDAALLTLGAAKRAGQRDAPVVRHPMLQFILSCLVLSWRVLIVHGTDRAIGVRMWIGEKYWMNARLVHEGEPYDPRMQCPQVCQQFQCKLQVFRRVFWLCGRVVCA